MGRKGQQARKSEFPLAPQVDDQHEVTLKACGSNAAKYSRVDSLPKPSAREQCAEHTTEIPHTDASG